MKKTLRIITAFILCFCLYVCIFPAAQAEAGILPDEIGLTQQTNYTCTLASSAMMLRARMYISDNTNWSSVTEESIKPVAWDVHDCLGYSWTYTIDGNSMTVAHNQCSGFSPAALKSLLNEHPEGIVLYDRAVPHAVFVCDYNGDTFYCFDPASSSYSGRRTLADSWLATQVGSQADILSGADEYWYVSSYSITPNASNKGDDFIAFARNYLGTPYVSGGRSPSGFDCCGFVWYVCNHFGIDVGSGNQSSQINYGTAVPYSMSSVYAATENMQVGDLLYFDYGSNGSIDHVAIYTGDRNIINAENGGVLEHSLVQFGWPDGYMWTSLCGIRRVLPSSTGLRYTVSYDANGGSGAPDSQIKRPGVDLTLSSDMPVRENTTETSTLTLDANGGTISQTSVTVTYTKSYYFQGWNTLADGSGTDYYAGSTYSENADATLYAMWDGRSTEPVDLPIPVREGFIFRGWSANSTSNYQGYDYYPEGDATLYAVWGPDSGTLGNLTWKLDRNGLLTISGTGAMNSLNYKPPEAWLVYGPLIRSVVIENGITNIGENAFYGCYNLTSVSIPNSVTSIDGSAFCQSGITGIDIPSSVTSIAGGAFQACSYLTSIVIPSGVPTISGFTFEYCNNLKMISIPSSVTSVSTGAFFGCESLTDVYYEGTETQWNAIDIYQHGYWDNLSLTNASLHCGVHIPSMPDLVLPASLTEIEKEAFAGGAFTYVKLPENLEWIDSRAFANCPNLAYIYISDFTMDIAYDAFYGDSGLTILGSDGSYAEDYAADHHYSFIPIRPLRP